MTLGEKIQELRRKSAMSQDTLAEKLEVSRQAVSKWERDEAMPETDKIVRLAQVFGVSTDYLLLSDRPQPQFQPQPVPPHSCGSSWEDRIERFIRRHGYKAGYPLIAWGAVLCVIALLVMLLLPGFGSGLFDTAQNTGDAIGNSWNSGIQIEGDVPQEALDQIYGQAGSGMNADPFGGGVFGDTEDIYDQQVEQMHSAWTDSVRVMAAIFGIPVLLVGAVLITFGVVIVVKGKKLAEEIH